MIHSACAAAVLAVTLVIPGVSPGAQPREPEARDMALVGFHDLQGRGAYQPVIHLQNGRWVAYVGHHAGSAVNPLTGAREENGTSLLDVTNSAKPVLLHHVPDESNGGAQMVRVCSGRDLPRAANDRTYMLRTRGHTAHEVWDVTLPRPPQRVAVVAEGLHGTHKNWWECDTGIAYLVSGVPGWRISRMTQVFDLSNPYKPLFIRDPYNPREIAYYVPASGGQTVTTNNVDVDDRGYIYIVDRHGLGMHVLQLTGEAQKVANLR